MVSARDIIAAVFESFRVKLMFAVLTARKEFAAAKFRGVWKRAMKLRFA